MKNIRAPLKTYCRSGVPAESRQIVQIFRRHTGVCQGKVVQYDGFMTVRMGGKRFLEVPIILSTRIFAENLLVSIRRLFGMEKVTYFTVYADDIIGIG